MKFIIISFVILSLITGFCVGRSYESQKHIEPVLQDSEYMVAGFMDDLVEDMCCCAGIDFENDEFVFTCPKCKSGGARWQSKKEWSVYSNWYTAYPYLDELKPNEVAQPDEDYSQTYCGKCYYPLGTDWKLIKI